LVRSYLTLLRIPDVAKLTAWQLFARLPLGMLSLAILLHVQATSGSYAQAGVVVACVSVAEAIVMPVTARLTGSHGVVVVTMLAALTNGAAMIGLAVAPPNLVLTCALGAAVGASVPPLMPVIRALYPQLVPADVVRALFALDTSAQELIWVVGPVAATFLATAVNTSAPLFLCAAVTIVGSAGFLRGLKKRRPSIARNESAFGRILIQKPVLLAMGTSLTLVASYMALEVGVVTEHGRDVLAGVAIGLSSLGSLIGGIVLGHRHWGIRGLVTMLLVVAAGTAVTGLVDPFAFQMVALFCSGFGFAPALAALYLMVSSGVEEHAATETFGWLNTGALAGAAIGTALGGVASDAHGATGAYAVATLLAVLAALGPPVLRLFGPIRGLSA
jgi:MFS family permease